MFELSENSEHFGWRIGWWTVPAREPYDVSARKSLIVSGAAFIVFACLFALGHWVPEENRNTYRTTGEIAFILYVVWVGVRDRRQSKRIRWAMEGKCPDCGYDLRATRQMCPECGRVFRQVKQ